MLDPAKQQEERMIQEVSESKGGGTAIDFATSAKLSGTTPPVPYKDIFQRTF